VQVGGFGAEVAATAAQATGCRIARLGAPRIHVGFASQLEAVMRIQPQAIAQAAMAMFEPPPG
jgi:pyruvate dehydrogenase E1 component beta subunit